MDDNVLIAGCGYVGCALADRLQRDGYAVWGLRRNPTALPEGVHPIAADLSRAEGVVLPDVPFEYVVYAASADAFTEAAYRTAYVDGLRHVIEALQAQEQRPARIVFTSSTGVYGQNGGEWVDETSVTEPVRATGRVLLDAEGLVANAPWPGVVVRLAGIYGPGRTRLIDSVRDGTAQCVRGRTAILNHIHRDDCAGVLAHVLALRDPASLYLGVDCEPADKNDVLRWIAQHLGVPEPPEVEAAETTAPARGGYRYYRNQRLLESGYHFRFPTYREGYETLLPA